MSKSLDSYRQRIAVTGGAGFIGSNLLLMLVPKYPDYLFVNIDSLTYAANLSNLESIAKSPDYRFEKIDICNYRELENCFSKYDINGVIHLAAESHVDRSIIGPAEFIRTNIDGTFNLLELSRRLKEKDSTFRFLHVSTDEVYGSAGENETFTENAPFRPNSPYAASKAAADHMVRSYNRTYELDTVITNCTNNYGPYQFPEKLIPLVIYNAINNKPIPIYGDGTNERDWLYVKDHCEALDLAFHNGRTGESYNISANKIIPNIDLVKRVCAILDKMRGDGPRENLIQFVTDRPGHDRRYALDSNKFRKEFNWQPSENFENALETTVKWYVENEYWLKNCISGDYLKYYETVYANR